MAVTVPLCDELVRRNIRVARPNDACCCQAVRPPRGVKPRAARSQQKPAFGGRAAAHIRRSSDSSPDDRVLVLDSLKEILTLFTADAPDSR